MPYDELGNFIPGEEPSVDQMRYELSVLDTLKHMAKSPANELPSREQLGTVAKGFGSAAESLGRGFVAGIPGIFGDINALARDYVAPHLPESVQSALKNAPAAPTTEHYLNQIPRYTEPFGDKNANAFVEMLGSAFSPDALTAVAPAAKFLGEAAGERALRGESMIPGVPADLVNPAILSAVKGKGGNWAQNSVNRLDSLKYPIQNVGESTFDFVRDNANPEKVAVHIAELEKAGYAPEQIREVQNEMAINKWIDAKIKPYVRNEMGTPEDPLRNLAERNITHIQDLGQGEGHGLQADDYYGFVGNQRTLSGMPKEGFARTPMGRDWEGRTDVAIHHNKAGLISPGQIKYSADIGKLAEKDPEAMVHSLESGVRRLGFDHLTDELKNAIDPNSDLPAHLKLKPESLDKVTVPQAVERVAKINEWRAEQMAKASKEGLKDFPVVHEDPSGYRIHELKLPDHVPLEGEFFVDPEHFAKYGFRNPEGVVTHREYNQPDIEKAIKRQAEQNAYRKLDRALKNEGEQMGHCVGGYTDSVAEGKTRIFSLRDPDGGAHATIEVRPYIDSEYRPQNIPDDIKAQHEQYAHDETVKAGYPEGTQGYWNHHTGVMIQEGSKYLKQNPKVVLNVEQIKGKGNKEVSDKYRTYIKDYLNNEADKIDKVEDLRNIGVVDTKRTHSILTELRDMYDGDDGIHLFNTALESNPEGLKRFMSRQDLRDFIEAKPKKMAEGGRVEPTSPSSSVNDQSKPVTPPKRIHNPDAPEFKDMFIRERAIRGGTTPSGGPSADMKQIMNPRNITYNAGGKVSVDQMRYELLRKQ